VTTDALLKKKAYAEFLEPFDVRRQSVIDFCKKINPRLFQDDKERLITFELDDPVGPTGTDT
jgi:phosphopantetheine adenylyltransferase